MVRFIKITNIIIADNQDKIKDLKLMGKRYVISGDQFYIYIILKDVIYCVNNDEKLQQKLKIKMTIQKPQCCIINENIQQFCEIAKITKEKTKFITQSQLNNIDISNIQFDQQQINDKVNVQLIQQSIYLINETQEQIEQLINKAEEKQSQNQKQVSKKQIVEEYKPQLDKEKAKIQLNDDELESAIFYAKLNKQKKQYQLQDIIDDSLEFDNQFYYIPNDQDRDIIQQLNKNNIYYEIITLQTQQQVFKNVLKKNKLDSAVFVTKQTNTTQKQIYDDFVQFVNITKIKTVDIDNKQYCICVYDKYINKDFKRQLQKYDYKDVKL